MMPVFCAADKVCKKVHCFVGADGENVVGLHVPHKICERDVSYSFGRRGKSGTQWDASNPFYEER